MKNKVFSLFLALVIAIGLAGNAAPVEAGAYGTSFLTSITYMNVGDQPASITIDFYSENTAAVASSYPVAELPAGAAASLGVGAVFPSSFKGSAVISSSQPLAATMVQLPQGGVVKNRPLSNGFSGGSTTVLIPTVLKAKFNTNSIFSIQNAGTSAANVTVQFKPATDGNAHSETISNLAPGAAKYFDMGTYNAAGSVFNGSVTVTSAQPMVATVIEALTTSDAVYSFEGVSGGAQTFYMPSAMCQFSNARQTSFYAVMNTTGSTANTVNIRFTGTVGSTPFSKTVNIGPLAGGEKKSLSACATGAAPAGFLGSATIEADQDVVAVAKIQGAGNFQTAHLGASVGAVKLAAPYVRYSVNKFASASGVQRANIAVQNIGTGNVAANSITVNFVGPDGTVLGSYKNPSALTPGAKFSVNPSMAGLPEFGYVADAQGNPKSFGGGAVIVGPSGSQLAAVVRVETWTTAGNVAEDYNAIPVQ